MVKGLFLPLRGMGFLSGCTASLRSPDVALRNLDAQIVKVGFSSQGVSTSWQLSALKSEFSSVLTSESKGIIVPEDQAEIRIKCLLIFKPQNKQSDFLGLTSLIMPLFVLIPDSSKEVFSVEYSLEDKFGNIIYDRRFDGEVEGKSTGYFIGRVGGFNFLRDKQAVYVAKNSARLILNDLVVNSETIAGKWQAQREAYATASALQVRELSRAESKSNLASAASYQSPSNASDDHGSVSDIQLDIPLGRGAGKYDIAVVIGNRTYTAGPPDVDYALRDADTMRNYLVRTLGYDEPNIIFAENATGSRFNEIFGREGDHRGQLFKWVKENESRVFVYYVGHGAPDPDTGDAYFVPVDSNPHFLKNSGYRLKTFYDNLAKLPAKSITVVLDACFSGNSNSGLLFKGVSSIALRPKEVQAPTQAVVFASARDDQMSTWYPEKQHSLFTYYFLKGLQGEADGNLDSRITVAEMEGYLIENVPYMARRLKGAEQQPSVSGKRDVVLAVLER